MKDSVSGAPSRRQFIEATAAVGLATALAGCGDGGDGGTTTPTPTPEPELEISSIQFVADAPTGYREYEPVPDKTYQLGSQAWVYFEPGGVASESAGSDSERIELTLEAEFTDADGRVVNTVSRTLDPDVETGQSLEELFLVATTEIPGDTAPGTWTVDVELTDEISGATATFTREFEVGAGERTSYLDVFRQGLETETEAEIRRLELDGATVVLEYESIHDAETEDWNGEIGFVGGVFAGLVSEGWSAERLSVTTYGSAGSTATWYLHRDDALAFANDEISNEEFARRVFDTLTFE